ncbi:MAG: ribosome recycling factor [Rhodospirillales bacterium]|jgi:ribosome recycling factor|nr:ribosome recycling factor [Alphaproteobacteria bacterium]MDP6591462.1 ribosome recycling factor [Alphaproteobacteria bacterium]MDP6843797.1 ribosome recycling factor [Rhodospirillales bacterium]
MAEEPDIDDLQRRMNGALEVLRQEYSGLRTGRASASLVEPIVVAAYDTEMPLNQVATINVPEPRMISIQVWDKSQVKAVEKAIQSSGLGLNPIIDGQNLRIPIPELNEERRVELAKIAGKYAEQAKVSVRNVRHDGMNKLKKMERSGDVSEDDAHIWSDEIQQITDDVIKKIVETHESKESEILQV